MMNDDESQSRQEFLRKFHHSSFYIQHCLPGVSAGNTDDRFRAGRIGRDRGGAGARRAKTDCQLYERFNGEIVKNPLIANIAADPNCRATASSQAAMKEIDACGWRDAESSQCAAIGNVKPV